jgi:hypothetical protein
VTAVQLQNNLQVVQSLDTVKQRRGFVGGKTLVSNMEMSANIVVDEGHLFRYASEVDPTTTKGKVSK